MEVNKILQGDVLEKLKELPDECVNTIITSPPYWGLRDYGVKGQLGLEPTIQEFLEKMLTITNELQRVLRADGVLFWNHGDCYGSDRGGYFLGQAKMPEKEFTAAKGLRKNLQSKCLCLQNFRLIIRMVDEQGWILRNTIIWHKPNHMPSSVRDRFSNSYEPVFMLVKNKKYWFDLDVVRERHKYLEKEMRRKDFSDKVHYGGQQVEERGKNRFSRSRVDDFNSAGKNPGDVWKIPTQPYSKAHFATFPEKLIQPMIKAGCPAEVCSKCGKARTRITETKQIILKKFKDVGKVKEVLEKSNTENVLPRARTGVETRAEHITKGWSRCDCNAPFVPGVVLDPFLGAGTTALVTLKLNRKFIGIELNKEYIKIAEQRIKGWKEQTRLNF